VFWIFAPVGITISDDIAGNYSAALDRDREESLQRTISTMKLMKMYRSSGHPSELPSPSSLITCRVTGGEGEGSQEEWRYVVFFLFLWIVFRHAYVLPGVVSRLKHLETILLLLDLEKLPRNRRIDMIGLAQVGSSCTETQRCEYYVRRPRSKHLVSSIRSSIS
jgi:hypothetical protein